MVTMSWPSAPPRYLVSAIITAGVSALFGFETGCIGPITTMTQFSNEFGNFSSTIHGLIVSSILLPAAFSSIFAGHLADWVGRPRGLAIGTGIFGIGTALEAGSIHIAMLIVARVITGLGEGLFLSTVIVYICEISPPKQRGVLASIPQFYITLFLTLGFFICYGTAKLSSSISWRLPFALQSILAFFFCAATSTLLPESPRWLALVGRKDEVEKTWDILEVPDGDREKESPEMEEEITRTVTRHSVVSKSAVGGSRFTRIFHQDVLFKTILGLFFMAMQQLAGIDGVLYYAPLLFQQAGLTGESSSFLASGVSALLIFASTIPAFLFADKWGRRSSTIYGGLAMIVTMVLIGSMYASNSVHASTGAGRWIVIIMIYLYVIFYSSTWAIAIRVYASEIQPQETRAAASSLTYTFNWVANFGVALTTPIFLAHSSFGVYFLFAGFIILTVIICALFMPETRGRTLEEIDKSFHRDIPASALKHRLQKIFNKDDKNSQGLVMSRSLQAGVLDSRSPIEDSARPSVERDEKHQTNITISV